MIQFSADDRKDAGTASFIVRQKEIVPAEISGLDDVVYQFVFKGDRITGHSQIAASEPSGLSRASTATSQHSDDPVDIPVVSVISSTSGVGLRLHAGSIIGHGTH